ncbi:unnamed protein product [Didymodactylos carnosus]|uniref:Uncharacterized protein n=1 Tax=Didymodactylos carnosus TaxID=1234261 RepID=A0A8S2TEU4_9BILA|nr:unnamed protein product [Didymodactylos carnosus]CAF4277672.1 unnamed protein product [Didymodactylos carnosus]
MQSDHPEAIDMGLARVKRFPAKLRFLDDERFLAGRTSVVDPALLSGDTAQFREEAGGDDCSLLIPIEFLKLFRCSVSSTT